MSSRAEGVARSRGSAEFSRQISPLPPVGRNDSKAASSGRNENQTVGRNDKKGIELSLPCARWSQKHSHCVHIRRISVPSGHSSSPPRTVFLLFRTRWSRKHSHCAHIRRIYVPSGHPAGPPGTVFPVHCSRWT